MTDIFYEATERMIAAWHGVMPPNDAARRMAADLAATIAAFAAQRDTLAFEDEPASFEAVLHEMRDDIPTSDTGGHRS